MANKNKSKHDTQRKEILGFLIMAFALLVFLGLISFHHTDYPNSGSEAGIKNWLGLAGAWISYYLFVYTIGYSCLLFPFVMFLLGWTIFLQRDFKPFFRICLYMTAIGLFLSTALAMPEAVSAEGSKYGYRLSGLLGGFIAEQLNRYLGTAGSVVVLLTFFIMILISATSWSMREALLGLKEEMESLFRWMDKIVKRPRARQRPKREKEKPIAFQQSADEKPARPRPMPGPVEQKPTERPAVRMEGERKSEQRKPAAEPPVPGQYQLPRVDLLSPAVSGAGQLDRQSLENKAHFLEEKLKEFDVRGNVVGVQPGPVITRFEIRPAPGVKISRFVSYQDDLALVMQASRVRVVAPIPGKAAVGIEIPNDEPAIVTIREIIESKAFQASQSKLTVALGKTIEGRPYVSDLVQMPHLLVAGATGSGKSVCLNTIITSILYRARPSEVKLVLIDPKKLELSLYKRLQNHHLTTREDLNEVVITTVNNAVAVLRSMEVEMERRYRLLARAGVRSIDDFNRALALNKIRVPEGEKPPAKLPYVVLVVDELADLMVMGAREVEEPIARLAQMSRAVGIHLILATQRPSVDVITGVIKANFPSRIAFQVAAKTDSRTILDRNGAEKLLGQGDMLFLHPREPNPIRIHGAFISTEEVQRVTAHVSQQPRGDIWRLPSFGPSETSERGGVSGERDELFHEAAKLVVRHQQGSASLLQRRLRIGYARAGRLIDELEDVGIVGPFDGSKAREVLVDEKGLAELLSENDSGIGGTT